MEPAGGGIVAIVVVRVRAVSRLPGASVAAGDGVVRVEEKSRLMVVQPVHASNAPIIAA